MAKIIQFLQKTKGDNHQTNHDVLWFYADVKITTNFGVTFLE